MLTYFINYSFAAGEETSSQRYCSYYAMISIAFQYKINYLLPRYSGFVYMICQSTRWDINNNKMWWKKIECNYITDLDPPA